LLLFDGLSKITIKRVNNPNFSYVFRINLTIKKGLNTNDIQKK
jgi:hypothetical protein